MKDFLQSFTYALKGIGTSLREQRNLRVQAIIALSTIGAGFYFSINATEWCFILLSISTVIGLEMINSSIESVVDLLTQERKPLAGKAKDVAAGAVLFASAIAVVTGVIIFWKYLLNE